MNNIEIHLIFANNRVIRFTDVIECIAYLTSHLCYITETDTIIGKEDVLLNVLSSGLTTEDETYINSQVAFNQKHQTRSNTDVKTIQ